MVRKRTRSSESEDPDFLPAHKQRATDGFAGRGAEVFRGVTHHIRTNRFEAHLWEQGKQLYLGGYDSPQLAALAFDIAVVRYRGAKAETNYDARWYAPFASELQAHPADVVVAGLRRHSKGQAVQSSVYKGVTRHQKGRWEARIGQSAGRKYSYLGLHDSEVDAAKAYDRAAIQRSGVAALLNFHLACYLSELSQEQYDEARAAGLLTDDDIALEMAHRAGHGMPSQDVELAPIQETIDEEFPECDVQLPPQAHAPFPPGGAAAASSPSTRRNTSASAEGELDLAGILMEAITSKDGGLLSPQTVLPAVRTPPPSAASTSRPPKVPVPAGLHLPPALVDPAGVGTKDLSLDLAYALPCMATSPTLAHSMLEPAPSATEGSDDRGCAWEQLSRQLFL